MLCLERGEHTMKKAISLLLTAIMVFSLVPALFVRDGFAADDKYVRNKTSGVINVYKEAGDANPVVGTLAPGAVAKYVSVSGAFTRIANPSGYVKTSELSDPYIITLTAKGGLFLYDGTEHKVTVTLTNRPALRPPMNEVKRPCGTILKSIPRWSFLSTSIETPVQMRRIM